MTDQLVLAWSVLLQRLAKPSTICGTKTAKKKHMLAILSLRPAGCTVRKEYLFNLSSVC